MEHSGRILGCLVCGGMFVVVMTALVWPMQRANMNALKAGEGSRVIRKMAEAHAAKPEVKEFRFDLGKGGDAGWKALGLPEDAKWHSFRGWAVGTALTLVASGNLDQDPALDEWQWIPAVPSPQQIREDYGDECEMLRADGGCPALPTPPPAVR